MKTSLKDIKNTNAEDITYKSFEEINELRKKEGYFNIVATAFGIYGLNGCVLQGYNTKTLYKITSRTTAIFQVL